MELQWKKKNNKCRACFVIKYWFINNKPVELTAVYNEVFGYYDYSESGKVLEQEITEEIPALKKTK